MIDSVPKKDGIYNDKGADRNGPKRLITDDINWMYHVITRINIDSMTGKHPLTMITIISNKLQIKSNGICHL